MFFKKSERSTGVLPTSLRLPQNAITPEQVLRHHRERRGDMGGQARSHSSIYVLSFIEKTGFSYENTQTTVVSIENGLNHPYLIFSDCALIRFITPKIVYYSMKSSSRQCPNNCGKMHRCHIKITENKIQRWHAVPWQFCDKCKMMMPD